MSFPALFVALVLSIVVVAAPTNVPSGPRPPACSLSNATLTLPPNQTALTVPTGTLIYVVAGVGAENYTCGSAGTFVSKDAFAALFDISCAINTANFSTIQDRMFDAAGGARGEDLYKRIEVAMNNSTRPIGRYYFLPSEMNSTDLIPVFGFKRWAKPGDTTGQIAVKTLSNLPSSAGSSNIDWLMLQNIGGHAGGSLAQSVMRVDTKGGQPPASCTGNETASVPFAAKYWIYK